MFIDPPEGWRYGFPKYYDKPPEQTLGDWLIEKGYPKNEIELAVRHSRFIGTREEIDALMKEDENESHDPSC